MRYIAFAFILFLCSIPSVSAHSGRTDANGGHNCNVGACAGTYHYHNGGSAPEPYVPPASNIAPKIVASPNPSPKSSSKPTPTPIVSPSPTLASSPSPSPEVKGVSISLEPTPISAKVVSTKEATAGDTAIGFGLLGAMIGGGYWGVRKFVRKIKS